MPNLCKRLEELAAWIDSCGDRQGIGNAQEYHERADAVRSMADELHNRTIIPPTVNPLEWPRDKFIARFSGTERWQGRYGYGSTVEEAISNLQDAVDKGASNA